MATPATPNVDYTKEVRFAVVMYGGVSLAIYINGVAQELLHLVKSTAKQDPAGLTGSELIYREISQLLGDDVAGVEENPTGAPTRFVVDIISGTSAGGINGVFLAKALANEQEMKPLEGLWVQEGEIQLLINDAKSIEAPLEKSKTPTSLLNSQRMYLQLLKALEGMDKAKPAAESSSLVDELDLFVTATDIRGVTLPIRLADRVVAERRHKNVLHFVYSKQSISGASDDRNDFEKPNNPFLAFAARCTSAFPFAFEPMRLDDIDKVLDGLPDFQKPDTKKLRSKYSDWGKFYKDYLSSVNPRTVKFPQRSFNDGGVLDNKPFSYATDTLAQRHASVPVDRKLIYIEPSPEHPELVGEKKTRPDAIENVRAALALPRNETIREDVQRILERNRLINRASRIMRHIDSDEEAARRVAIPSGASPEATWNILGALAPLPENGQPWAKDGVSEAEWEKFDLVDMIKRKGKAYLVYHRLQIAEVTDRLADLVVRVGELDKESDYFMVIRALLKAWRDDKYTDYRDRAPEKPTTNEFLIGLGLSYPIRRINFLRKQIDRLYAFDEQARDFVNSRVKGFWPRNTQLPEETKRKFRAALLQLKRPLNQLYVDLRAEGRTLRSRTIEPSQTSEGQKNADGTETGQTNPTGDELKVQTSTLSESGEKRTTIAEAEHSNVREMVKAVIAAIRTTAALKVGKRCEDPVIEYFLANRASNAETANNSREAEEECTIRARELLKEHPELVKLFNDAANEIERRVRLARNKAHVAALGVLFPSSTEDGSADGVLDVARSCLGHYYDRFVDYDMVTFPIFYETDVGESDVVEIIRVSPEDARALIDEGESGCHKLAGTSLAHFGAFLNEDWRRNDILWGRLDGAERIISALIPDAERAREFIGRIQSAILWETVESLGPAAVKNLLVEALMRPRHGKPDAEAVAALSRYLENIKRYGDPALADLIKVGELTDYYRESFKQRARLEPESTLRTAARATTVIGKVLSGISKSYGASNRYAGWVVRLGLIFWGLVEVAVPQSFANLIFRHWLKVIYTFEVLAILGGVIFTKPEVTQFGWVAFFATAVINAIAWWLSDVMRSRGNVQRFLVVVAASVITLLTLIGILKVASVWFGATVQNKSILFWLHDNANAFRTWLGQYLPATVISVTAKLLPILVAVALVVILWLRADFGRTTVRPNEDSS